MSADPVGYIQFCTPRMSPHWLRTGGGYSVMRTLGPQCASVLISVAGA